ncbi:efflux RND transporter permease subunit [Psychrobacillus sp. NPDC093200]|uniref:efflux RND transporter permease subunit n=1 Tax=Psychrobacillus sp. NPDC093200 TaxID=3390656 RepID=UPI003D065920
MSSFTRWAFGNKAGVAVLTVLVLVIGVFSYFRLPMEFLPSADNPQVTIITMGPGRDAKTMESEVTSPIERAVVGLNGKSSVYSRTGDGYSHVDLVYESGYDMKQAKQEVQEALTRVPLPPSISEPVVSQLHTSMIPIINIAITFEDGLTSENMELAKNELKSRFQEVKGVANVDVYGITESTISIRLDEDKLADYQIPLQSVMTVLQGQNTAVSVGEKNIDGKTSNIKVIGDLTSIEKLKNLSIVPDVTLGEIAVIEETIDSSFISRFNGKESLDISITKDSTSNAVTISKEIEQVTKELNEQYKQQKSVIYVSSSDLVQNSVHTMMKEVLLGALFATIVIMIFLRNIRSTFITIISIPLSLCLTLFLLWISGVTLNILTLGGVAVAVGRLVDDSIVVIENIFRKMQTEKFSVQMVIDATKQVGVAITASTLTTVAVFLPMSLLDGTLQDFLLPFALTVTYSLLASLLVALTVVPIMSAGLLKNTKLPEHKPAVRFPKAVTWSLNHKWVIFVVSLFLFAGSIGTYFLIPKGAVDNSSADFITASLSYPSNTPVEEVKEKTIEMESLIREMEEVDFVFAQVGTPPEAAQYGSVGSQTEALFSILLDDKKDIDKVIEAIEEKRSQFPKAELEITAASFMMGGTSTSINIDIVGDDLASLEKLAPVIQEKIEPIEGIEKVTTNQDEKKTVHSLVVDSSKGNTEQIAQQLSVMLNKTPIGTIQVEDKQKTVFLEPILDTKTPEDLKAIQIMTSDGPVPVSSIATLQTEQRSTIQLHKDGKTYLRVTASVDPAKLSKVASDMNIAIFGDKDKEKGIDIPKDTQVFIGGSSSQQAEEFEDLFLIMLVSIGLVFLIMVITFKSIRTPIAILCSLPLAAIGAVLGIVISGISVDITALLGALMLIGIVVTNAIVLLDRVKQNEKTMTIRESLVEATSTRMRPIFMTAIATICAMLPLLLKQAETGSLVSQSLAIVVIGGLAMATLLTLIVVPCIYELLYYRKSKKQRMAKERS